MEGFTDYYALTLNFRAQLLEPLEYCKKINSVIDNYNSSPVRNAPDAQIKESFWKDTNLQRLPYLRGCLLAFHWDRKLKNGGSSLDEVMLALLEKARARNYQRFSEEDLVKFLAQSIDGAAEDIEKYIICGEILDVPECTLSDISTSPLQALKP
jgi:predicted metalloprotease with PDZ domain